ncbi:molybdate ABC transporter substrate-binding protein [Rhodothalassium salexigens]|uniref:molybdate ABC transporter substrate-binding protein n=1 Tax=Rhodothalassium salexigens TaxID=1086 RepID=UPI001913BB3E|nr:molybdate ABC transporter substrate-binding protein [Rhodothalassium salexigens]MBK5911799.1 molybdate ABC transporter substrate-binding protein [Rhodothalassium salexigens]
MTGAVVATRLQGAGRARSGRSGWRVGMAWLGCIAWRNSFSWRGPAGWLRRVLLVLSMGLAGPAAADPLLFSAASTGRAMDAAIEAYGGGVTPSYAASGILARQIERGAPADLFLSANPDWMAHLVTAGVIAADAPRAILSNRLALIAPAGAAPLSVDQVAAALGAGRFAMANPAAAPVGRYGQSALEALGLWDTLGPALVPTRNTVATVAAVASGEAVLGLVYVSDARGVDAVDIVLPVPAAAQPEIRYLIAPTGAGQDPEGAAAFLDFLASDQAAAIFAEHGFLVVGRD